MDLSNKYILMCAKSWELQKNHKFSHGDNYSPKEKLTIVEPFKHWVCSPEIVYIIDSFREIDSKVYSTDNLICVFRQDQLQKIYMEFKNKEIVSEVISISPGKFISKLSLENFISAFDSFVNFKPEVVIKYPRDEGGWLKFTSIEQLCLAFVMYELYHKIWVGPHKVWKIENRKELK